MKSSIFVTCCSLLQSVLAVEVAVNGHGEVHHEKLVRAHDARPASNLEDKASWGILKNIFGGGSEVSEDKKSENEHSEHGSHGTSFENVETPNVQDCMLNEFGKPAEPCTIEKNSMEMVNKYIQSSAVVLEVGARYGGVSCAIAKKQSNSGNLVAVEPDPKVWEALAGNIARHSCNVNVLRGVVGTQDVTIEEKGAGGFGTVTSPVAGGYGALKAQQGNNSVVVHHMGFGDLQSLYNLKFDTAVIDCEGCFPELLAQNPSLMDNMKLLIVEDHNEAENKAVENLTNSGSFKLIWQQSRQRVLERVNSTPDGTKVLEHVNSTVEANNASQKLMANKSEEAPAKEAPKNQVY
mmetsp:Transcript_6122/g.10970  ORF Transcript_6122/g.10970 Transcript_6122/m.10970 type:complete len:350 (-) Transcript_6122:90-1139(-)